jgi:hypothetical protein
MTKGTKRSNSVGRIIDEIEGGALDTLSRLDDSDGEVSGVTSGPDLFQKRLRGVSWSGCVARSARLSAAVFEDCQFHRVVFRDCELSGASFVECNFRDCYIVGGKAGTILSVVDCSMVDLSIFELNADRVEIQGGTLTHLTVADAKLDQLVFAHVASPRRSAGQVVLTNVSLASVGGISQLANAGVQVSVDPDLWSLFGDLLLREMGLERLDKPDAAEISDGFRSRQVTCRASCS